jgi:hypothetical protein
LLGALYSAGTRLLQPGDDQQQRGLADPVGSDEPYPFLGRQLKIEVAKDIVCAERLRDFLSLQDDHDEE